MADKLEFRPMPGNLTTLRGRLCGNAGNEAVSGFHWNLYVLTNPRKTANRASEECISEVLSRLMKQAGYGQQNAVHDVSAYTNFRRHFSCRFSVAVNVLNLKAYKQPAQKQAAALSAQQSERPFHNQSFKRTGYCCAFYNFYGQSDVQGF